MAYYENLFKKTESLAQKVSFYSSQIPYRESENENSPL